MYWFEYVYSLKLGWEKIFTQERQKLKPNDISVLKCFVLNRFLYEYSKVRILEICEFIVSTFSVPDNENFNFIRIQLWVIHKRERVELHPLQVQIEV